MKELENIFDEQLQIRHRKQCWEEEPLKEIQKPWIINARSIKDLNRVRAVRRIGMRLDKKPVAHVMSKKKSLASLF